MKWLACALSALGHLFLLMLLLWQEHSVSLNASVINVYLVATEPVSKSRIVPVSAPPVAPKKSVSPPLSSKEVAHREMPTPVRLPVHSAMPVQKPSKQTIPVQMKPRHHHEDAAPIANAALQKLLANDLAHAMVPPKSPPLPVQPAKAASSPPLGVITNPDYAQRLRTHIYQYAVVPWQVHQVHPVCFRVSQDARGQVIALEKVRSSGSAAYDDALYRAILLASPLPLPQDPRAFQTVLLVTFYPGEQSS